MKYLPLGFLLLLSPLAHAQTPAPPVAEMQKWVATLDATWQETYGKEVTAPFDAEMAKLAQQYLVALDANIQKASTAGDLDQTVLWRAERERFALAKDVPAEDEATAPVALKQLRASWRTQAARLQADRAPRAKAVLARYDAVLAQAQKQLTQAQRIDEALLLKKQREDVAARWAVPAAPVVAVVEPAKPPVAPVGGKAPAATSLAKTPPKLAPREVLEKLLAAGVSVTIGEYRSQTTVRQVNEAPDKFNFYSLGFHPRKDGVPVTDKEVALLENIPELRVIHLDGVDVTDAGFEHLRGLSALQYVDLTNLPKVTEAGFKLLADLPKVESIRLWSMPSPEVAIKGAAGSKRLPQLTVGTMEIPEAALAALSANNTLLRLHFEKGATGLTPAGLAHLAKMKQLNQLQFLDFPIDDAMAAEIGKLEGLQNLNILESRLTEAGFVAFGKLRNMQQLAVTAPPVTPATIAALKRLKSLKNFVVRKATPPEDMAKLKAALKGVNVKE